MSCVVFTGGGTGGHIFPGIAVAEVLREKNIEIVWIASNNGSDQKFVESAGIDFKAIPAGKLRRYFSLQNFFDIFKIIGGFFASLILMKRIKPLLVFSKGGFVSVPPCLAAKICGIPVITHECDFSPGLATRLNTRFATQIFVSYPETAVFFAETHQKLITVTGNPVRRAFYSGDPESGKKAFNYPIGMNSHKPFLLIIGGSLGAKQINDIVFEAIEFLTKHFFVVHQVGPKNSADGEKIIERIKECCPQNSASYVMTSFISEAMPNVLAAADIMLSRAGANSLWEAAAAAKPMVLIPLDTGSSRGDQIENADFFRRNGAATVLRQDTANADGLCQVLKGFIDHPDSLREMAEKSAALAKDKPAEIIANLIIKTMEKS